jgi:type II secretory pathway component PulF
MVSRGIGWYAELAATRLVPILIGAVAFFYVMRALRAVPAWERLRSRVALALPVFGTLTRWSAVARFLRTLSFAERAGVTFHQALDLAGEATGHASMQRDAHAAATDVRTGSGLSDAVAGIGFLPRPITQMLAGAGRTGELERRLESAADFADERHEAAVDAVSSRTAVVALVGGAVVALIALAIAWRSYYEALFERVGV